MKKNLNIISTIPLFNGLPEDQIAAIKKIAIEKQISKGEIIVSEGDEGEGFFVIAEGRVKVFKVSSEGKEQILHIFGPGQPFGEVPVFSGQRFPANAQAIDKTRVLLFPRRSIVDLISANPSLALNMLAIMSIKLRQFALQIENLSLKEMPARLASYLISLADEQNDNFITLKISKCTFFSEKIGYLGHIIKPGRLEIDQANTKLLRDARPRPRRPNSGPS